MSTITCIILLIPSYLDGPLVFHRPGICTLPVRTMIQDSHVDLSMISRTLHTYATEAYEDLHSDYSSDFKNHDPILPDKKYFTSFNLFVADVF